MRCFELRVLLAPLLVLTVVGCRPALPAGKPISALTADEAAGHTIYQQQCARCHAAYTAQGLHGPSLLGILRKPYLPSGSPATEERAETVIVHGRGMMPAFGGALDAEQLRLLLKYLHTL